MIVLSRRDLLRKGNFNSAFRAGMIREIMISCLQEYSCQEVDLSVCYSECSVAPLENDWHISDKKKSFSL